MSNFDVLHYNHCYRCNKLVDQYTLRVMAGSSLWCDDCLYLLKSELDIYFSKKIKPTENRAISIEDI